LKTFNNHKTGNAFIDRTGIKCYQLTVIEIAYKIGHEYYWTCLCDCGQYTIVRGSDLINGKTKSCGCRKHKRAVAFKDETGNRYGKITVIK
jgi:hypothetical protein